MPVKLLGSSESGESHVSLNPGPKRRNIVPLCPDFIRWSEAYLSFGSSVECCVGARCGCVTV